MGQYDLLMSAIRLSGGYPVDRHWESSRIPRKTDYRLSLRSCLPERETTNNRANDTINMKPARFACDTV